MIHWEILRATPDPIRPPVVSNARIIAPVILWLLAHQCIPSNRQAGSLTPRKSCPMRLLADRKGRPRGRGLPLLRFRRITYKNCGCPGHILNEALYRRAGAHSSPLAARIRPAEHKALSSCLLSRRGVVHCLQIVVGGLSCEKVYKLPFAGCHAVYPLRLRPEAREHAPPPPRRSSRRFKRRTPSR